MVISDSPNYVAILKVIAKDIKQNQVSSLLEGRKKIISSWINAIKENVKTLGNESIDILTNDINNIIDKILGVDFQ